MTPRGVHLERLAPNSRVPTGQVLNCLAKVDVATDDAIMARTGLNGDTVKRALRALRRSKAVEEA